MMIINDRSLEILEKEYKDIRGEIDRLEKKLHSKNGKRDTKEINSEYLNQLIEKRTEALALSNVIIKILEDKNKERK